MKGIQLGPLGEGGKVVVVGGGPGGVATAIALMKGARSLGQDLQVTIVEGKQFIGEQQFNQCSGVFSPPVFELVEQDLGVPFPTHLARTVVTGYVLHTERRAIILDGEAEPSISLRRIQFDAYMLEAAREWGVSVLPARLTGLEFHAERAIAYTDSQPIEADVIVGAFGLDEGTGNIFHQAVGYRPPPALDAIITKYHAGDEGMRQFGQRIHAFLPADSRIEFGAVTPKRNHLTINIAGATVDSSLMDAFLSMPNVQQALPCLENARRFDPNDLRYFKGRFPCGLARIVSGDRFVMVGDAAGLVRAFKGKGVTSAIQTGVRAANVILHQGISAGAFKAYHTANLDILGDFPYGRFMRQLTILASRLGMMDFVLQAAEVNASLRQALFDAVSANHSYRDVIRESLTPGAAGAILRAFLGVKNR